MTEYTNVQAIVYQGQLDLICDTRGGLHVLQKQHIIASYETACNYRLPIAKYL